MASCLNGWNWASIDGLVRTTSYFPFVFSNFAIIFPGYLTKLSDIRHLRHAVPLRQTQSALFYLEHQQCRASYFSSLVNTTKYRTVSKRYSSALSEDAPQKHKGRNMQQPSAAWLKHMQRRNEARWRRGKEQVWRPHIRTWGLSEANVLYWSTCDIVGTFGIAAGTLGIYPPSLFPWEHVHNARWMRLHKTFLMQLAETRLARLHGPVDR